MLSSTTSISARIDSFRISIINNLILLLFEIDLIFIGSITAITNQTKEIKENVLNKDIIDGLTTRLDDIQDKIEKEDNTINELEGRISNLQKKIDANSLSTESVSTEFGIDGQTNGGYKFKSKKIKRKTNNKRKTKNKRNTKNKRKTKKYI